MIKVGTKITLLPEGETYTINGISPVGLNTTQGWINNTSVVYASLELALESDMIAKCLVFDALYSKIGSCTERTSFPQFHLDEMAEKYGFDLIEKITEISSEIITQIVPNHYIPYFKFQEGREGDLTAESELLKLIIENIPNIQGYVEKILIEMFFIVRHNSYIKF